MRNLLGAGAVLLGPVVWAAHPITGAAGAESPAAENSAAETPAKAGAVVLAGWMDAAVAGNFGPLEGGRKSMNRAEAEEIQAVVWTAYKEAATRADWDQEILGVPMTVENMRELPKEERHRLQAGVLKSGEMEMPYVFVAKGEKPAAGWPLFISMHGGGQYHGPKKDKPGPHGWAVNTREWQTQMQLSAMVYKPAGLYFVPRMADDNLGRWWHKHNIELFTRMISRAILYNEVDPNKVYLMGISQGGYGSCHLAPYMADLFAAAGPMAGGMMTVTENLRNLPFRSDIGEFDTAYKRIIFAKELHAKIDAHRKEDPEGYENILAIQEGKGHGIDYSLSPSWLNEHTRNPYPDRVVWRSRDKQGLYRESFYWISLCKVPERGEISLVATLDKEKNSVEVTAEEVIPGKEKGEKPTRRPLSSSDVLVHLNDELLDLDREVTVTFNGKPVFQGMVQRDQGTMMRNLVKRGDPNYAFPAEVRIKTSEG